VLKFFLHVSRDEQRERFLERLNDPEKYWKYSPADVVESRRWRDYMAAYEETIRNTATREAPWYVVPADHKWFTRLVVAAAIVDTLGGLDLRPPPLTQEQQKAIKAARIALSDKAAK
jgi:polyphosphate kinase 2 (PPK2 family)